MSKFNAVKVTVQIDCQDVVFDSKLEHERYVHLKLLERSKTIKDLVIHPQYVIQHQFKKFGRKYKERIYTADFSYINAQGWKVVEDVKGGKKGKATTTRDFSLRVNMFNEMFPEERLFIVYKEGDWWKSKIV